MNTTIYILGILLQAIAGVIALLQVRHAPRRLPWLLIALSSLLIVVRRTATIEQFMEAGRELATAEILTLIISLFFFLGIILMTRMFREVRGNQVALGLSEQRYRDILNQAADAIIINDSTGRILDANQKACTNLGYTHEELLASNIADIDPEAFRDGKPRLWDQVFAGEQINFEINQVRKDGSSFPAEMTVCLVRLPVGYAMLSIVRDITGRKQAESALCESEKRYRTLFQSMTQGAFYQAADGSLLDINPAGLRIFGLTWEEFYTRNSHCPAWRVIREDGSLLLPEEHPSMAAFRTGQPVHDLVCGLFNPQINDYIWLIANALPLFLPGENKPYQVFVTLHDITDRKRAEEALKDSEYLQKAILNSIPDLAWLKDVDGKYIAVNEAFAQWAGHPSENIAGKTDFEFSSPELATTYRTHDLEVLKSGQRSVFEEYMITRKGESIAMETIKTPLFNDIGTIIGTAGIARDITERKRLELALQKRLVALTSPLDKPEGIAFDDLFELPAIQRIQDEFAAATGVASLITQTDGTPITRPSNFCRLCEKIIRCTEKGRLNCIRSDAMIGRYNPEEPVIQPCLSGGLWDAGASISVGDRHIANWLIGQVRDETQTEDKMLDYARTIGADESDFIEAFREVPSMSQAQFRLVAQALFTLANQLSTAAYQNIQQARFITERRLADKAYRQATERLQLACRAGGIGIWELDIVNNKLIWDEQMLYLYGIEPDTFRGTYEAWHDGVHPDDLPRAESELQQAQSGEKEFDTEFRVVWPDGTIHNLRAHARVQRDESGRPTKLIGTNHDITKRKQTEDVLRKNKELLTEAQRLAAIGSWEYDYATKTGIWSENMPLVHDLDPAVTPRSGYWHFMEHKMLPENRQQCAEIMKAALEHGKECDLEYRFMHSDGSIRTIHSTTKVVRDTQGRPVRMIGTTQDITERKAAEQLLKQKQDELERFTYAVSHDLKSPMVTIQTFMGHLAKDLAGGITEQVAQDQVFITSAANNMNALLDELLKFSKVGRVTNPSVEATLQEMAQEAIGLVAGRIDKRGVRVQVTQEPVVLYGDRVRLVEVFQNLIDNAVKFMGEQSKPLIEIGTETKDGKTVCFVRDNGMGFDLRHKDKLFGLFEKLNPEMEGSGMGLALVKKL